MVWADFELEWLKANKDLIGKGVSGLPSLNRALNADTRLDSRRVLFLINYYLFKEKGFKITLEITEDWVYKTYATVIQLRSISEEVPIFFLFGGGLSDVVIEGSFGKDIAEPELADSVIKIIREGLVEATPYSGSYASKGISGLSNAKNIVNSVLNYCKDKIEIAWLGEFTI